MEDNDLARNLGSNAEIRSRDEGRYKAIIPDLQMGKLTTKTATNDKESIEKAITILKLKGETVRKRICHETTTKNKSKGTFYKIEIKTIKNN